MAAHGYEVRVLNTVQFQNSMHYNPFDYIRSEKDILKLVNVIMANTKGHGSQSGEDFWLKAESLLYQAYIGYIWYECPPYEKNMNTLLVMLNASCAKEHNDNFISEVDKLFIALRERNPDHFALRQYLKFKTAAGKTLQSIFISCGARMAPFDLTEIREFMSYDELSLDTLGDRKCALFIILSDTDDTFNFIAAMLYAQLFHLLCDKADRQPGGKLMVPVRCLLDEFANIGQIPKFEKLIATIRSRNISASVILQSQSQLKTLYRDTAETIIGNCDSFLFLGGKELTTLKEISDSLGKETIQFRTSSKTRANYQSHSENIGKTGRSLMTPDELSLLDGEYCILQIRGIPPFRSRKYPLEQHPKYAAYQSFDAIQKYEPRSFSVTGPKKLRLYSYSDSFL